jgi:hypothetical protein
MQAAFLIFGQQEPAVTFTIENTAVRLLMLAHPVAPKQLCQSGKPHDEQHLA